MLERIGLIEKMNKSDLLGHNFYRRVAIDVDSCLSGIEGIDLLAKMRGVGEVVSEMTRTIMGNGGSFSVALAKRLEYIQPNGKDLDEVSNIYIENIVKDARGVIKLLNQNGVDVMLLSGGFRRSIIPLAEHIEIPTENIYANDLIFDDTGKYLGFDGKNPLSQNEGKKKQIAALRGIKDGRYAIVGDGVSELETEPATDFRIGFGGFVSRERVMKEADVFFTRADFCPINFIIIKSVEN